MSGFKLMFYVLYSLEPERVNFGFIYLLVNLLTVFNDGTVKNLISLTGTVMVFYEGKFQV